MSRRCLYLLIALVPVALLTVHQLVAQNPAQVQWRYDYNEARREAESKGVPLLLDFGHKDCYWCDELDRRTFSDPRVAALVNARFIPLKIDGLKQEKLSQALRIKAYPTLVFAAPDGRILKNIEGFQDADQFHENLQRVLAGISSPEWAPREYELAQQRIADGNSAQAIPALQRIVEEVKTGPLHQNAKTLLDQLEHRAAERLRTAKQVGDEGRIAEASKLVSDTLRDYPGLQATRNAGDIVTQLAKNSQNQKIQRSRIAQELLVQAKENYRSQDYMLCLDRCETLVAHYGDLPEGKEAYGLAKEIKNNPEWMQRAADHLSDRLAAMYLALGEAMLNRGQPQQAIYYFERVVHSFPESRRAENARVRLEFLHSQPTRRVEFKFPNP